MNKSNGRDHNKHLLSYLNWNYIYTNAHYYSKSNVCTSINNYIFDLNEIIEISHEKLKESMYFVFLKTIKNKVRKDCGDVFGNEYNSVDLYFNKFNLNELKSLYKIYKIMINNIFYPWHFRCRPLGYLALKYINSDKFYMNPYPHSYTNESFRLLLSSISESKIEDFVDKESLDIYKNFDFDINIDAYDNNFEFQKSLKKTKMEIKALEIIKDTIEHSVINSEKFFEYNELITNYDKFKFDSSSNFSRSVGLYLWEKIYFTKNKYDKDSVLDWFYKTNIYKKLNLKVKDRKKEYLGDKSKEDLKKLLKKTNNCIDEKKVLSFH